MKTTKNMINYTYKRARKYSFPIVIAIGLLLFVALIQFQIPQITQTIIDKVIPNKDFSALVTQLIMLGGFTLLMSVADYFSTILISRASQKTVGDLRNELYQHVLSLDFEFFEDQKTGDIMDRLNSDIGALQGLISTSTFSILGNIITFVWVFVFILINDWRLILLISVTFPLLYLTNRFFNRRIKGAFRKVRQSSSKITHHLQTTLTIIPLIKNFVTEDFEAKRFRTFTLENDALQEKATELQALHSPSISLIDTLGKIIVLGYGATMVMNGSMTVGIVVTYLSYLNLLQRPMKTFSSMVNRFQQASVSFERIQELLQVNPKILNNDKAYEVSSEKNDIAFNDVFFQYEEAQPVLSDISFTIPSGKVTALVGSSGSGKTTITKLLTRLYEADFGQILINDTNIKDYSIGSLRSHIGVVSQDVDLIDGTIRDNITYGAIDVSDAALTQAAQSANILTFIKGLPHGFDTQVGERGMKLSGGQKQRIALARVFLKNAPILILDEATASLDNESERYIQASLDTLIATKTSLVIAHRLSTIQNADTILVLENGRIVEQGTHLELLELSQRYSEIYNAQFK
ncbi:ABC transporter ATP-binding protein [Erysipelothrix sp. HDW6C]|uniref:ABC transporter ATP-binding protein n=1 Tax=Erysipelothrix sp. HDW6C TaxID=2714930 RepID=UPI00140CA284|nr:ABC transporter ATP-binding protein [Erysipelothrix sp. HDW6C]QIK69692.1 ABC transporter ATP-binding protein [Erysipelothrix sp. HDW6C]